MKNEKRKRKRKNWPHEQTGNGVKSDSQRVGAAQRRRFLERMHDGVTSERVGEEKCRCSTGVQATKLRASLWVQHSACSLRVNHVGAAQCRTSASERATELRVSVCVQHSAMCSTIWACSISSCWLKRSVCLRDFWLSIISWRRMPKQKSEASWKGPSMRNIAFEHHAVN